MFVGCRYWISGWKWNWNLITITILHTQIIRLSEGFCLQDTLFQKNVDTPFFISYTWFVLYPIGYYWHTFTEYCVRVALKDYNSIRLLAFLLDLRYFHGGINGVSKIWNPTRSNLHDDFPHRSFFWQATKYDCLLMIQSDRNNVNLVMRKRLSRAWTTNAADTFNTSPLRHCGGKIADDIFKFIFFNENFEFRLKFHWSLILSVQLTISQHWFR